MKFRRRPIASLPIGPAVFTPTLTGLGERVIGIDNSPLTQPLISRTRRFEEL